MRKTYNKINIISGIKLKTRDLVCDFLEDLRKRITDEPSHKEYEDMYYNELYKREELQGRLNYLQEVLNGRVD